MQTYREKAVLVRVSPEVKERWKKFADNKGLSVSESIRTAMNRLMEQDYRTSDGNPPEFLEIMKTIMAYQHGLKDELRDLHLRVKRGFDTLIDKTTTLSDSQFITADIVSQSASDTTTTTPDIKSRILDELERQGKITVDSLLRKIFGSMTRDVLLQLQKEEKVVADAGGKWRAI